MKSIRLFKTKFLNAKVNLISFCLLGNHPLDCFCGQDRRARLQAIVIIISRLLRPTTRLVEGGQRRCDSESGTRAFAATPACV